MAERASHHAPLLEAVPNVSEGRRGAVVAALAAAVEGHRGARLLQVSADADHHRTVLTLAGSPEGLHRALLALYACAAERLDLRRHQGVHPRLGAVDVVPFVPLSDCGMATAVAAARRLGEAVAARHALPVYLYAEAAAAPARRRLADLRRGGLAGIAARLADPAWRPDFGPTALHPRLGATAIGARGVLIAVNAQLATADVAIARAIARAVRASSGGLAAVQALGLYLESRGCAQVSMNLLDYRRTSLEELIRRVAAEAASRGTAVASVEIVGMLPAAALPDRRAELPPFERLDSSMVLEEVLGEGSPG
ncbi:MAG TPA: glutamate formimidoyltransferase [Thermoanaerobaculia bacterium]|nr:glutamate formimidoyltransferase [Thermoanaerobaculia bacterium]